MRAAGDEAGELAGAGGGKVGISDSAAAAWY